MVGGALDLRSNQLQSLPDTIGNLIIGGDLALGSNRLCELPFSFGGLTIHGNLGLSENLFESIPNALYQVKLYGDLDLEDNQLPTSEQDLDGLTSSEDECNLAKRFKHVQGRIFTKSSQHFNTNQCN